MGIEGHYELKGNNIANEALFNRVIKETFEGSAWPINMGDCKVTHGSFYMSKYDVALNELDEVSFLYYELKRKILVSFPEIEIKIKIVGSDMSGSNRESIYELDYSNKRGKELWAEIEDSCQICLCPECGGEIYDTNPANILDIDCLSDKDAKFYCEDCEKKYSVDDILEMYEKQGVINHSDYSDYNFSQNLILVKCPYCGAFELIDENSYTVCDCGKGYTFGEAIKQ